MTTSARPAAVPRACSPAPSRYILVVSRRRKGWLRPHPSAPRDMAASAASASTSASVSHSFFPKAMLSLTLPLKTTGIWKTMPTRLRSSLGSIVPDVRESTRIVPESASDRRLISRNSVDLPAPDGPMIVISSPRYTVRSRLSKLQTGRSPCPAYGSLSCTRL